MAARMAMMAMTTSNSIKVKAWRVLMFLICFNSFTSPILYCARNTKKLSDSAGLMVIGRLKLPLPSNVELATTVQLLAGSARLVVVRTLTGPLGEPLVALMVIEPL